MGEEAEEEQSPARPCLDLYGREDDEVPKTV